MIYIASPCGYIINRNFIECREDTVSRLRMLGYRVESKFYQGVNIVENRNLAIFDARDLKAAWLIFIDTDMEFGPEDVLALMQYSYADVVTGVCKTGEGKYALYSYDDDTNGIHHLDPPIPIVDICGGAFIGIRNKVISYVCHESTRDTKWKNTRTRDVTLNLPFNLVTAMNGAQFSEDISFCLRLRELGIKIHVADGAVIGHEKIVCIK